MDASVEQLKRRRRGYTEREIENVVCAYERKREGERESARACVCVCEKETESVNGELSDLPSTNYRTVSSFTSPKA